MTAATADELSILRATIQELRASWGERGEAGVEAGISYRAGDPVLVHIRKRAHRYRIDDGGGAVERAGRPPDWLEVARQVVDAERSLNVSRTGVVFVPAVEGGMELATLATRVAEASVALYQELLDVD
jgi:hypothetical protein